MKELKIEQDKLGITIFELSTYTQTLCIIQKFTQRLENKEMFKNRYVFAMTFFRFLQFLSFQR